MNEDYYIGIDVGGSKILALVANGNGVILSSATRKTPSQDKAESLIEAMAMTAREAASLADIEMVGISAVGVAAAGAVDPDNGTIVFSPHLPSMDTTPVGAMLSSELQRKTFMGNDANLAALGEQHFGAGQDVSNFIFITISTGIGGGIVLDGNLCTGNSGFAGEIGHMTVDANGPYGVSTTPGAWESLCSGSALVRIAKESIAKGSVTSLTETDETGIRNEITAKEIFLAARSGDNLANEIIAEATKYLGTGLTSIVNLLSPERIIIGGGLANEWDSYISPAINLMRDQSYARIGYSVDIIPAALGPNAGALGAIVLASHTIQ